MRSPWQSTLENTPGKDQSVWIRRDIPPQRPVRATWLADTSTFQLADGRTLPFWAVHAWRPDAYESP